MTNWAAARAILADADVIRSMREAFAESQVGSTEAREQGGFILSDTDHKNFTVARLPSGQNDSLRYPICRNGQHGGKTIVGTFHTHPNVGDEWLQGPSPNDIRLSQLYPETMGPHQFVISVQTVYHVDNDGNVWEVGSTSTLLGI